MRFQGSQLILPVVYLFGKGEFCDCLRSQFVNVSDSLVLHLNYRESRGILAHTTCD